MDHQTRQMLQDKGLMHGNVVISQIQRAKRTSILNLKKPEGSRCSRWAGPGGRLLAKTKEHGVSRRRGRARGSALKLTSYSLS